MSLHRRVLPRSLRYRIMYLFRTPMFWWITIFGNSSVFGGASLFYWLESGSNPRLNSFLDGLMWSVGIVTTVGGTEIFASTTAGKILTIFMMMGGAIILWSYMALFVGVLVHPDLVKLQHEVEEIQHDLKA